MLSLRTVKDVLSKRLFRNVAISFVAIGITFVGANANAACGDPAGGKAKVALKLPFLRQTNGENRQATGNGSIVGLWHVTYEAGGQFLFESFKQWHSDGTELENANLPPIEGNVCVGVWKLNANGVVQLNHTGWNFDLNGNSTGTFTITERDTVSAGGNNYRGEFDYKIYDVDGNLLQEVKGTQTATRITAN